MNFTRGWRFQVPDSNCERLRKHRHSQDAGSLVTTDHLRKYLEANLSGFVMYVFRPIIIILFPV